VKLFYFITQTSIHHGKINRLRHKNFHHDIAAKENTQENCMFCILWMKLWHRSDKPLGTEHLICNHNIATGRMDQSQSLPKAPKTLGNIHNTKWRGEKRANLIQTKQQNFFQLQNMKLAANKNCFSVHIIIKC